MKLKTRLIIGFIVVIILPITLSIGVVFSFGYFQVRNIEENYGVEGAGYSVITNPLRALNEVTDPMYRQLQAATNQNVEMMDDVVYLESVNRELQTLNSYLVVRKGERISFEGKEISDEVRDVLPEYGAEYASEGDGQYVGDDLQLLIKQVDYVYKSGARGTAFIITDVGDMIPEVKTLVREVILAIIFILILTAALLIFWIYRGVVIPLGRMKIATQNIKDGNLDFELEVEADDEIGQLCRDFEEMRKRLRDTTTAQVEEDKRGKELISNISHDLKTPITAIKGYAEGIMDGVADTPEKMERYIKTIYNKANEMELLINELTLYSKIDSNRIPYNFATISVKDYFEDCAEELKIDIESRGIEFDYLNYVENDVRIIADPEQLKRVINNIISNSAKYMDKKQKHIHFRVKDVGDFVQVEIEDNGKGIGAKELPNIFDRFYRTDASRNSATGGSGIGLSIVKKIIEEHGGNIWATSKEGIGTVMYFVIRKYQEVPTNE